MKITGKDVAFVVTCLLWVLTAWLISPLIHLDRLDITTAKWFMYRISFGLTIMIIFFGKTLFDLLFTHQSSKKRLWFQTLLLSLYTLVIAVGLIFVVVRLIGYYIGTVEIKVDYLP
ncbi:MAG: hypothetical protein MUP70_03615 [Candidatus Aminicenantes bacterium]|nr:hypothetical protein [Candidatus Aminicenantes bacterium]